MAHPRHPPDNNQQGFGAHNENSVDSPAMLKSQVWFMAAGRDRDQRRCQLLSRQPIPPGSSSLSPRNPTPSQATRTGQGNARNSLNTFGHCFARSQARGTQRVSTGPRMRPPSSTVSRREGGREDRGNFADGNARASGMANC